MYMCCVPELLEFFDNILSILLIEVVGPLKRRGLLPYHTPSNFRPGFFGITFNPFNPMSFNSFLGIATPMLEALVRKNDQSCFFFKPLNESDTVKHTGYRPDFISQNKSVIIKCLSSSDLAGDESS